MNFVKHVQHVQYIPRCLASCSILAFNSASTIINYPQKVQDLSQKPLILSLLINVMFLFVFKITCSNILVIIRKQSIMVTVAKMTQ